MTPALVMLGYAVGARVARAGAARAPDGARCQRATRARRLAGRRVERTRIRRRGGVVPGQGGCRGLADVRRDDLPVGLRRNVPAPGVPQRALRALARRRIRSGGADLVTLTWQYGRTVRRSRRRAQRARGGGQDHRAPVPRGRDSRRCPPRWCSSAEQPAVYCVPGRPATIVLTTGALAVLGPAAATRGLGPRTRSPRRTAPSADHAWQGDASRPARRSALHPRRRGGRAARRDAGR